MTTSQLGCHGSMPTSTILDQLWHPNPGLIIIPGVNGDVTIPGINGDVTIPEVNGDITIRQGYFNVMLAANRCEQSVCTLNAESDLLCAQLVRIRCRRRIHPGREQHVAMETTVNYLISPEIRLLRAAASRSSPVSVNRKQGLWQSGSDVQILHLHR